MRHRHDGRGSRHEVSTASRDPSLQLVKGDPYGTLTFMGLPVPPTPPTTASNRYLFLLASAQFNMNHVARLVGIRQFVTIGALVPNDEQGTIYPIERPIVTPNWHFSDANISWHLRRYELQPNANFSEFNRSGTSFKNSSTPSLLFVKSPLEVGGYVPPLPPGNVVVPDLGNFHDIRFPWEDDHAWDSLDIEIEGPCTIGLFASVQQTVPATRATLALPSPLPGGIDCLDPEDAFILNFPLSVYKRVAGALIFEDVPFLEDLSNPQPWGPVTAECSDRDEPKRTLRGLPSVPRLPKSGGT